MPPRKLYDPLIPPERQVVAEKEALAARKVTAVTRAGEQFICTCMAGHFVVTSDAGEAEVFANKHRLHQKT
jgi:hypothetical protein